MCLIWIFRCNSVQRSMLTELVELANHLSCWAMIVSKYNLHDMIQSNLCRIDKVALSWSSFNQTSLLSTFRLYFPYFSQFRQTEKIIHGLWDMRQVHCSKCVRIQWSVFVNKGSMYTVHQMSSLKTEFFYWIFVSHNEIKQNKVEFSIPKTRDATASRTLPVQHNGPGLQDR